MLVARSLRNCLLLAGTAGAALALVPASSQGAVTFGSRLNNEPSNAGKCMGLPTQCTMAAFIHPIDPNGDPYSGGAPIDGVITLFRIKAFGEGGVPTTVTFRLANVSRPDPNNDDVAVATDAGTGPTVLVNPGAGVDTAINQFPARVPVKKGNQLAVDGNPDLWVTVNNSSDAFTYRFDPPLVAGQGPRGSSETAGELLVAATVEPDADGDGFGDETQDQCARQNTTQGPCDDTKPEAKDVKFNPNAFAPLPTGASITAKKKRKKKARRGSTVSYTLSEAATMTFTAERQQKGRKRGKKCIPRRKRGKRCTTTKVVTGSFTHAGKAGANSFKFSGRINGRKLKTGTYRLTAIPTDVPGNRGNAVRAGFRIVK
jgi:hypothetical protein